MVQSNHGTSDDGGLRPEGLPFLAVRIHFRNSAPTFIAVFRWALIAVHHLIDGSLGVDPELPK